MAVKIGQMLDGKYRVVRVLGKGGMGAVYEGENTFISRRVAIKVIHSDLIQKPDIITRFELEAQAAGRIQNDHINEVLDLGTLEDGARFIVLEFLEGETLKDRVKRVGRLTPMQAVHVVRQVLVGLSAAHRAGIVHRDLKPGNVFILWEKLGQRDFVKIIDFGVSKFLLSEESEALDTSHANAVLGTPHYMAPEQLRHSGNVDARADLYSVGIILYKAVTGRVPYHAQSLKELVAKLSQTVPVPASQWVPGLDATFLRILDKAIERDPARRFQSADELLAELDQWRLEMTASELPYFTEDGLISTMHNVSLRRGSSSDTSVPPVPVSPPGESLSIVEPSIHRRPDVLEVPPHGPVLPGAGLSPVVAPAQSSSVSSGRSLLLITGIALLALGGLGAGAWHYLKPSPQSPAAAPPIDSAQEATPAMPVTPGTVVPTVDSRSDDPTISITDLPAEATQRVQVGAPKAWPPAKDPSTGFPAKDTSQPDGQPSRPKEEPSGKKKKEPAEPDNSEWGY